MPDTGFDNLFVVALVALLAPLAVAAVPALRVPAVIVEIVAGVLLGPDVLGVVDADLAVQVLSVIGLAFLLFTVGLELDVRSLRGTALRLAAAGYAISLVLGLGACPSWRGNAWEIRSCSSGYSDRGADRCRVARA